MSKPLIHLLVPTDGELFTKSMETTKELHETIEKIVKEKPDFDPTTDATVIVGEKRCIKPKLMGASIRYDLTLTGCGCGR